MRVLHFGGGEMPQITITYNCSNGNFGFNPDPLQVPFQANDTITWKVTGTQVPSGTTVQFPSTGGITFAPGWPGSTPAIDPNDSSKYTASDNNTGTNTVGDFKYTTKLQVTDGTGTTTYPTHDPDVENDGAPAMVSRA
jgi:hypothetical protein